MSLEKFQLPSRGEPLVIAWPQDVRADGFLHFDDPAAWRSFDEGPAIHPAIPQTVTSKFERALMDRHSGTSPKSKPSFVALLQHMVTADGLTDADIPMVVRCNGAAVGQLTCGARPTLAERRNLLARGDPFDGLPTGGLLELVRDLINYAYRGYIAKAQAQEIAL